MSTQDESTGDCQGELEQLRASQRQLQQHNAILLRLALAQQSELSLDETLQAFTEEVAQYLSTQRVAVGLFNDDHTILRCQALCDRGRAADTAGAELPVDQFPAYIAALESQRVVAAEDAATDPRTREFADILLAPLGITSMLHVPIRVGGQLRGVMCCEHVGPMRKWSESDKRFAASVCDLVAGAFATFDMRTTQETMRALLDSAAQGVIAVNESGQITLVNSLVEKIFGYEREELLGQPLELLIPEDLKGSSLEIHDGTLARSPSERIGIGQYFTGQRKDGTDFPAEIAVSFVKQDGEHLMLALLTDVTQRLESERRLEKSEELYRTVVEDQTDLISRCTPEGIRTFVNNAYCEYHGKLRDQLLGRSIFDLIPPHDRKKIRDNFAKLSVANPVHIYEHRVLCPDGRLALNQWLDRAIFDENGKLREIQSIGRDITEQRESEARLREAQRLESIAVLASGIAHDFNNLLTPILVYSEGLRDYFAENSVERSQVLQIQAAANRAKELVRQILTFGRKSDVARRQPTAIAPIVHDTLQLVRASVPAQIDFRISVDTECGTVEADATELYQILSNLCTNACQAMPAGGTLTVSASEVMLKHTELPHGLYVQLIVKDTGSGISPENIERIFDPFFSTKPPGEGTGLGLSVVHGTVTALGGAVEVQGQPGEGTTFVVYLPCTDKSPVEEEPSRPQIPASTGHERVLVVDDEQSVRESTQFMLQQLGYRVTTSSSANEALTRFSADPTGFDIVVSDMTMPRTSGIELLRRVRELRSDIPVVLITGFGGLLNEEELHRVGIDDFIIKPVNSETLGKTIRRCLDSKEAAPANAADESATTIAPKENPVLVVDDDHMVRNAMARLLRSLGFTPIAVASTDEALQQLAEQPVDAVIVDHFLEGENGFESAPKLREQAAKSAPARVPLIIGMTGSADLQGVEQFALDGYLVKPFSADQLREVLAQASSVGGGAV